MFDTVEGLGRKFLFNKLGKHAFTNKIIRLNRQELVITLRLLVLPSQIRKYNGWIDIGSGQAPVRILMASRILGKDKIYFLYKINEHPTYQAQLLVSPDKTEFEAA